jgi:type IX secretion system PorP/SprF family membrane protein
MKRFALYMLALGLFINPLKLSGQLFPLSDHYIYDALSINPAFAGCHDALSATILYRNQWVGFDDSPKKQMLSIHTPIKNNRIGIGALVENYTIGIFKKTSLIGNYAFRMELQKGILAMGLGFGVVVNQIAWDELRVTDPNDVYLINSPVTAYLPALSAGTYYYTKKFFIGFSLPLFVGQQLGGSSSENKTTYNFSSANYFLSGGYVFNISPNVKFLPSMLVKYYSDNVMQIDYNAQLNISDRIWFGAGYRSKNMLVAMLKCNISSQIQVAYSYNFDVGLLGRYRNGSHEVVLNYTFRYLRNVIGPRNF